jgi:hypothetical protein
VTQRKQEGSAKEGVQVLDVSQILARSLAPAKVPAMAAAVAEPTGGGNVSVVAAPVTPDVTEEAPAEHTDPASPDPSSTEQGNA